MAIARWIAGASVVCSLGAGAQAWAQAPPTPQAPPPSKAVVIKGKAPVATDVLKVKLPRPAEADLDNGIHVMVLEDRRVPQISFQLVIAGAGGYFDPAEMPGLASFTAAMMREGTTSRTSQQISEQIETIAATVNVGTGMSTPDATVSGSSLTEHFETVLGIAADILLNPAFAEEELQRYKQRTRAGLVQQRSNPNFLASEMFSRVIYGNHPAARISPTPASLEKTTRDALAGFHRTHYAPDHAILAIAGDISMAEARKLVEQKLGGWKKAGVPAPVVTDPPAIGAAKVYLVARPNSVQTNFVVGTQSIMRTDPDYDVLSMMNKIIGGGPTGRLFINLREDKGYTYGAYSGLAAGRFRGNWQATTDVRTEVTEPALRDLMAEIARMRDEAVPEKEFETAKRSLVASFALGLESPAGVLNNHITRHIYKLPADYWDRYPERVMAVTREQVQAAAKKYLDASRIQIVAVGDAGKIGEILKKVGTLETYDTEGNPIAR